MYGRETYYEPRSQSPAPSQTGMMLSGYQSGRNTPLSMSQMRPMSDAGMLYQPMNTNALLAVSSNVVLSSPHLYLRPQTATARVPDQSLRVSFTNKTTCDTLCHVAFSPDGRYVTYSGDDEKLYAMDGRGHC